MAAMSVNTVMDVGPMSEPCGTHTLPFATSSLTVMDEAQVEAKKKKKRKLKSHPVLVSSSLRSTRPPSQSRCTSEGSERLQQRFAEEESNSAPEKSLSCLKGFARSRVAAPVPPLRREKVFLYFKRFFPNCCRPIKQSH